MVALGDTRLSEKLVTEIQSRVKHQAENFTKIRAHMKRSQAWAPFRSSLWSSPFTKCEETVRIFLNFPVIPRGYHLKKNTQKCRVFQKMECPLDIPFQ